LKQRRGKRDGTRARIDLLLVGRQRGYDARREAIEKTLQIGCSDVSAVLLLLNTNQAEGRRPAEAVEIGALSRYDRPQPTTENYDQLLRKWPETGVISMSSANGSVTALGDPAVHAPVATPHGGWTVSPAG
jgi:hypothetical protein